MTSRAVGFTIGIIAIVGFWAWRILDLVNLGLLPAYDEAVYLTQVTPGLTPQTWSASRSPGIAWLVSPITHSTDGVVAVRAWLLIVTLGLFALVLAIWSKRIGLGALVGGALFASAWMPASYAPLVFPNVLSALLVALMIGVWLLRRTVAVFAVVPVALAVGLMRPLDAFVGLIGCGILTLAQREHRRDPARYIALALSGLAILLPFVAAAAGRGGLRGQLQVAEAQIPAGWRWNLDEYVSMFDGPVQFPDPSPTIDHRALTWVITLLAIFAGGAIVVVARRLIARRRDRAPVLTLGLAGALLAAPYLFYIGQGTSVSLRYLTPGLLVLCIAAGSAVRHALHGPRLGWGVIGLTVALVATLAPVEARYGDAIAERRRTDDLDYVAISAVLRERTQGEPCALLSQWVEATFAVMTGCPAQRWHGRENIDWMLAQRNLGKRVVVVANARAIPREMRGWHLVRYQGSRGAFYVYDPPEQDPVAPQGTLIRLPHAAPRTVSHRA